MLELSEGDVWIDEAHQLLLEVCPGRRRRLRAARHTGPQSVRQVLRGARYRSSTSAARSVRKKPQPQLHVCFHANCSHNEQFQVQNKSDQPITEMDLGFITFSGFPSSITRFPQDFQGHVQNSRFSRLCGNSVFWSSFFFHVACLRTLSITAKQKRGCQAVTLMWSAPFC